MKSHFLKSSANRHPSGFTLLEVILAVGLSAVLMLAIASAIDLYRRMSTAAQDDLSEARLVRAVFKKFDEDIAAVVPPQPVASTSTTSSSSSSGGSSSGSSGSSSGSSSSKSGSSSSSSSSSGSSSSSSSSSSGSSSGSDPFQYIYSRSVFGLYGDAQSLVLNTLTPHRLPLSDQQQTAAQSANQTSAAPSTFHGDMKVVGYFLMGGSGGGSSILSPGASGQASADGTPITSGLARLEGDRTAIGYTMETSSTGSLNARIIAPEVQAIQFRYFDSTGWNTSYSGATSQALPQAVEITISVGGADPYGGRSQAAADQPVRVYRHVVAITTAAAPVPIAQQNINSTTTNMSQ